MDLIKGLKPHTLGKSHSQEDPTMLTLFNFSPEEDSRNSSPSPVSKFLEELSLDCSITDDTPDCAVFNGKPEDENCFLLNGKEKEALQSSPQSSQSSPVKQKPPAISKKPKLFFVPPFSPQPIKEQAPSQHDDTNSLSRTEDQIDAPQRQVNEEVKERKSEQQEEEVEEALAESSETSTEIQDESHISASASQDTSLDHELRTNGEDHEEEEEDGDGTSSTTGSISSREDDTGESFKDDFNVFFLKSELEMHRLCNERTV